VEKLRAGSIAYINSLPVDLGLLEDAVPHALDIRRGVPSQLNERIGSGLLQLGPVSAMCYARRQRDLLLLPDLSISSESGVKSVLLFTRRGLRLEAAPIATTAEGETTPALLHVLCRMRHGFTPRLLPSVDGEGPIPPGFEAALVIGDRALEWSARPLPAGVEAVDLAEAWRAWTGTPFVFAVWVVWREVYHSRPEDVRDAHEALLASKRWGEAETDAVVRRACRDSRLPEAEVRAYYRHLRHDLDERMKRGMRLFFDAAAECGLLGAIGPFEEIAAEAAPAKGWRQP
jgi:chorismate dehydratase